MSKNITLSPKHGLNPTIPVCFFCNKPKNEIAIMGRINRADDKVPMHTLLDYEPCDECKAAMEQGITLIEVTTTQPEDGRPPISNGGPCRPALYPSGPWCVTTENFIQNNFTEDVAECTLRYRKGFLEKPLVSNIIKAFEAIKAEDADNPDPTISEDYDEETFDE